jgi:predicted extracellular nuclease
MIRLFHICFRFFVALMLSGLWVFCDSPVQAANVLRISQIFAGAGLAGQTPAYQSDYIELFNASGASVQLDGMSLQYEVSNYSGVWRKKLNLSGSIPAYGYFLVCASVDNYCADFPLPPDAYADFSLHGLSGKVALAANNQFITGKTDPDVLDFVGYGTVPLNEWEGSTPAVQNGLSAQYAAFRSSKGCRDTDQNGQDFSGALAVPRNRNSPPYACNSGDAYPVVSQTTPINGETNAPLAAELSITFSEAVSLSPGWLEVSCESGARSIVSLLPETQPAMIYKVTLSSVYQEGENCTALIHHAAVSDADSSPKTMFADYGFAYKVRLVYPEAISTLPANNAHGVALNSTLTFNFSQPVQVAEGWLALTCTRSGDHVYQLNSTLPTSQLVVQLETPFWAAESCTATLHHSAISASANPARQMQADFSSSFDTAGTCSVPPASLYNLSAVQGNGELSPLLNQTISVRGTVSGDFQDQTQLGGFFMTWEGDGDPSTSDGLFVKAGKSVRDIQVGQALQVTGVVAESQNLTQLESVSAIEVCGVAAPVVPLDLSLPLTSANFEPFEGMLVHIQSPLFVVDTADQAQYGQLLVSSSARLYHPLNALPAGNFTLQKAVRQQVSFVLDDSSRSEYPAGPPYFNSVGRFPVLGDRLSSQGLTGFVDTGTTGSGWAYRLQPVGTPEFINAERNDLPPALPGAALRAGSLNVKNYFTSLGRRGASSAEEQVRQRSKLAALIKNLDVDILGLEEVEDNADAALVDLVNAVNQQAGSLLYDYVRTPAAGPDEINVALIYKPGRVTPVGAALQLRDPAFNRYPLAQTFEMKAFPERFSLIVNHFKARIDCPGAGSDPGNEDLGNGLACWNALRVQQAGGVAAFVRQVQTLSGDDDVLVLGDLNAYPAEPPLEILRNNGLVDLGGLIPAAQRYSYLFEGWSGALDHAFATPSLALQVSGAAYWHINADQPAFLDYNLEHRDPGFYQPDAVRASDHDPILVGIAPGLGLQGGSREYALGRNWWLRLQAAPGVLNSQTVFVVGPVARGPALPPPGNYLAGSVFDLSMFNEGKLQPGLNFSALHLTFTFPYQDLNGLSLSELRLYRWTETGWQEAVCGSGYVRNSPGRLEVDICQPGTLALFAKSQRLFAPLVK